MKTPFRAFIRPAYAAITRRICSGSFWLFIIFSGITNSCFSQTVGNWTLNNTVAGTGSAYNSVGSVSFAGVTSTAFNGGIEYFGEGGWPAGGINTGTYMQFSLTPNAGYELNLTDIVLRIRRSNTGSPAGSGPTQWSLRSSLDGFAADISSNSLTHTYNNYTVTLTGFHHIYTTITFRLYGYNVTISSGGTSRLVADNINVQGLTSVLPIQFTGVQAAFGTGNHVAVKWQVANTKPGTRYNVQRSLNGTSFNVVGSMDETSDQLTGRYNYIDAMAPAGNTTLYYRIEARETSGLTSLSPVVKLSSSNKINETAINYISIQGQSLIAGVQALAKGSYTLIVHSANGAQLQQRPVALEAGSNTITLPLNGLPHGVYLLSLYDGKKVVGKRFVW